MASKNSTKIYYDTSRQLLLRLVTILLNILPEKLELRSGVEVSSTLSEVKPLRSFQHSIQPQSFVTQHSTQSSTRTSKESWQTRLFLKSVFRYVDSFVTQQVWSLRNGRKNYVRLSYWAVTSRQLKTHGRFSVSDLR